MRMRFVRAVLVGLGLLALGCRYPWSPAVGPIVGTVRELNGAPVYMAKVSIEGGPTTFTDMLGRYSLAPKRGADSVTITARDGYTPGRVYAVTHFGTVHLTLGGQAIVRDIVLDQSAPI